MVEPASPPARLEEPIIRPGAVWLKLMGVLYQEQMIPSLPKCRFSRRIRPAAADIHFRSQRKWMPSVGFIAQAVANGVKPDVAEIIFRI